MFHIGVFLSSSPPLEDFWTYTRLMKWIYINMPDFCLSNTSNGISSNLFWQVMAEMCQSGYKDALRFLEDNSEYYTVILLCYLVYTFLIIFFADLAQLPLLLNCCYSWSTFGMCHWYHIRVDRSAEAGVSNSWPQPFREPTHLLLQACGNHQGVGAAEAPPSREAALVAGWADHSAHANQERCGVSPDSFGYRNVPVYYCYSFNSYGLLFAEVNVTAPLWAFKLSKLYKTERKKNPHSLNSSQLPSRITNKVMFLPSSIGLFDF